jgi:hypothetical protein
MTVISGLTVGAVACVFTFYYTYCPNSNTRICGWPVPVVIFHRDAPGGQWLDYVGPTTVLAMPINLVLWLGTWFLFLWILNKALIRKRRTSVASQVGTEDGIGIQKQQEVRT